jgi:hypothetical protein
LAKVKKKGRVTVASPIGNTVFNFNWENTVDQSDAPKEKRKRPRFHMDFPLEYRILDGPDARGGIVVDGSERGLRIHSIENMPVGTRLNIAVIFPKEFQMTNFEVTAEIIWKDLCLREDWNGFQYGLKFILIKKGELRKLKELLSKQYRM